MSTKNYATKLIILNEKNQKDSDGFRIRKLKMKFQHYVNSQKYNTFLQVGWFLVKNIILYPSLGNLTTHLAMIQYSTQVLHEQ